MPRFDRPAVARRAIALFVPQIKQTGEHHPATPQMPDHWSLNLGRHSMMFSEKVVRLHTDESTSDLLDIWMTGVGKILSVSWYSDRPEDGFHISTFKGELLQELIAAATVEEA